VREGDRVVFTMKNRSDEKVTISQPSLDASPFMAALYKDALRKATPIEMPMHHSMDFHAGTVAPDDKWRGINPGESIRFEWVANYPGVYLYHCGAPPVLMHLAMGQYGVVVVSPRNGFETDGAVDRSYVVVQSEFYLKEGENGLHVLDYEAARLKQPSHRGVQRPHAGADRGAARRQSGDRVRLLLPQRRAVRQLELPRRRRDLRPGVLRGNPRNDSRGMQTVPFGASNGGVVEFIAPEEGTYILVDHEFADAEKGAVGFLKVRSSSGEITRHLPAMQH
jgi:nitrite reductase (NO-forming)